MGVARPRSGPAALPFRFPATALERSGAARIPGPDCISFQPPRLHLSRRPPPAPRSSRGALGPVPAPSRPLLAPPRALLRRPGFPEAGRGCWAALRGCRSPSRSASPGTGRDRPWERGRHRFRGFPRRAAESRAGHRSPDRHPSPPELGDTRALRRDPRGGTGSRRGDLATVSLRGAAAFTFPSASGGSRLLFPPLGEGLASPPGGWGILGALGRAASQQCRDGMEQGGRVHPCPIIIIIIIACSHRCY